MKRLKIVLIIVFAVAGLLYAGLAYYYSSFCAIYNTGKKGKCYLCGTIINDIYCTGMTSEQVDILLRENFNAQPIHLLTRDGEFTIMPEEIEYGIDFLEPLNGVLVSQKPLLWVKYLLNDSTYEVNPVVNFNEELLNEKLDSLGINKDFSDKCRVKICLSDEGYVLEDNSEPSIDYERLKADLNEFIKKGENVFEADDTYYSEYVYSQNEKDLMSFYEKISAMQGRRVAYYFGSEKKSITPYDWALLLNVEEKPVKEFKSKNDAQKALDFNIPEEKAVAYIDSFLDEYNTYNNRYFVTHSKELVHVTKGNYGNKLNVKKEEEWFVDFVNSKDNNATRVPEYLIEAKYREKNDFGDTFIEVSLDEQHLWYYVDGEVYVDTPITSGSLAHGGTDPRVVYVYTKIPNKWLNGPTWHNFVKYWVAIQGSIGIHDASWRKEYGGQNYIYNGSHGCINTPLEAMEKIFDKVEIGTPVIVYSLDKNKVKNDE